VSESSEQWRISGLESSAARKHQQRSSGDFEERVMLPGNTSKRVLETLTMRREQLRNSGGPEERLWALQKHFIHTWLLYSSPSALHYQNSFIQLHHDVVA